MHAFTQRKIKGISQSSDMTVAVVPSQRDFAMMSRHPRWSATFMLLNRQVLGKNSHALSSEKVGLIWFMVDLSLFTSELPEVLLNKSPYSSGI